ncbi:MAG: thiol-disulfide oxidoreductase DCC family protein [Blastocatellia bacterium]
MIMSLTILFDAHCDLCRRIVIWLESQPKYVEMLFVPAASDLARRRFPELDHDATLRDLHVVSHRGDVYRSAKAWLMCLWAIRDYREWSLRLATPELMPLARRAIARISSNRFRFTGYRSPLQGDGLDLREAH